MLNSILALGCRFWAVAYPDEPAPPASTERYFINQADRLLDLDLMEQPSTQLVQVLLLMVQCLTNLKLSNKAWVLVGMAVRSAQAIEMSLDSDGESQYQSEERRKTWWMCVLLDRYARANGDPSIHSYHLLTLLIVKSAKHDFWSPTHARSWNTLPLPT